MKKTNLIRVKPGEKIRLKDIDTGGKGDYKDKEESIERHATLEAKLAELQIRLYAEDKRSLLIVFQAMDTGGKDGATKRLFTGVNSAGIHVTSFKAPSDLELSHDFLWRIHAAVPARGMIGVWNRSHYEDVLVTRVHELIDDKTAQQRFEAINNFEKMLTQNGTTILKFFLHISKNEQKERLQARLDDPTKNWKFSENDLKERALWGNYQDAYQDMLRNCSTEHAPWNIIPADYKWARDIAISECVTAVLDAMDPKFPHVDFDPKKIVIE